MEGDGQTLCQVEVLNLESNWESLYIENDQTNQTQRMGLQVISCCSKVFSYLEIVAKRLYLSNYKRF